MVVLFNIQGNFSKIKHADKSTKEVLDVVQIQMVVLINIQGNVSKIKPAKKNGESIVENVLEIVAEISKTKEVDFENLS